MTVQAINATRGTVLADQVEVAGNWWRRFRGLMFRRSLPSGHGLWLVPCQQVHTFWMRFPIDALFLDREGRVLAVVHGLRPGRVGPLVRGAHGCLELPAGTVAATGTQVGDRLQFS